jgi:hypothetical protein
MTNRFALYFCRNNKKPPEQVNLQRWFEDGNRVVPILPVCVALPVRQERLVPGAKAKARARCMIYSDDACAAGIICSLAAVWPISGFLAPTATAMA